MSLFHRYDYIYRPLSGNDTWLSANTGWQLSDTEILKAAAGAHSRFFLGARPGKASRFAVIDIDASSKYHNARQLKKILGTFAKAGLSKNVLFRSSRSGGWHVYFFFAEPISSRDIYKRFHSLLSLNGFSIDKGQLEIFPHPGLHGSTGYGLRLPLQPGFAWLDKATQDVLYERDDLYALEAMGMFTADLHEHAHSYEDFQHFKRHVEDLENRKAAISLPQHCPKTKSPRTTTNPEIKKRNSAPEDTSVKTSFFGKLPPGINPSTWLAGRSFMDTGLTSPGQRADAIFSLSHYLFYGDPERGLNALGYGYEHERQWLIEKILGQKHNGKSEDINESRADAYKQIERAAHWQPPERRNTGEPKKFIPYGQSNIVWIRANAKRKSEARKKISAAVEELKSAGKRFTFRELWKKSGCSTDTLLKHGDIWRQDYEDLANGFFAADPGEYNAVERGTSSESPSLSSSNERNVPLGLLAARQIVYELSMRSHREKKKKQRQIAKQTQADESTWRSQVYAALAEALDPNQTISKIKTMLAFLIFMLMSAPSEEDLSSLQAQISTVKSRLFHLTQARKLTLVSRSESVGRPPPAD